MSLKCIELLILLATVTMLIIEFRTHNCINEYWLIQSMNTDSFLLDFKYHDLVYNNTLCSLLYDTH